MKTLRSLLCFLLLMSASVFSGNAQTISREQAQTLATEFFAQGTRATRAVTPTLAYQWDSRHLSPVATIADEETAPAFYTFAPESGEGFVIISSDANNPRILGYSLESNLPDVQNLPDGMRDFLTEYSVAPAKAVQSRANYDYNATSMGNIKVNLNTAPWGQSAPFNKLCFTSTGQQAITGCVPTAYSILMHYHKWPLAAKPVKVYHSGTGESRMLGHEYDWANMLHSYSGTYTEKQADAVATLMRDVGYAYGVVYGTGSTASGSGGEGAGTLIDLFKYKSETPNNTSGNHTRATVRDILGNDVLWKQYILQSLDAGLPIPYSSIVKNPSNGETRGRHIFILDGYTDNGYYHFNWGWGGSGNGWFTLDAMVTDAQSAYSIDHKAYFMLSPDKGEPCTITVSADCGTCGTVSASYGSTTGESISVYQGANVTLTATPADGYLFEKWTCGTEEVSTSATCKVLAEGDADYVAHFKEIATIFYTVDVSSAEESFGLVKIDGEAAAASANKTVNHGTTVTLTAEAKEGYLFKNWTRDDEIVSIDNPWVVTVEESANYKANFVPKQQGANITISTTTEGSGSVTINGESANTLAAKVNDEFTLTATPASGYYFVEWRVGEEVVSTKASFTTSAQAARTYKAVFAEKTGDVTIRVYKSSGGSALVGGTTRVTVVKGEFVSITATPLIEGKKFAYWSVGSSSGGEIVTNANPYSFVALSSKSFYANFVDTSADLSASATATAGVGGTASVTGDMTQGGEVTFKAKANDGYCFSHWENSNAEKVSTESYYSTVVASNLTLKAVFEVSGSVGPSIPDVPTPQYTISVNSSNADYGTVAIEGYNGSSATVDAGTTLTLVATPKANYKFVKWTCNGEDIAGDATITITADADKTYVAVFDVIPNYSVNVTANPTNGGTATIWLGTEGSVSVTVQEGTEITLQAEAHTGYTFKNWTCGGEVVSTDATFNVTVAAAANYVANFEQDVVVEPEVPSTSPEDGKAYIIRNVHPNGNKYMLVDGYSGGTPMLPVATDGAAADYSNVFICRAIDVEQKKYAFVNAKNGKFMAFHGKSVNNPFTSDGFYSTYDKTSGKCDFIITEYATKPGHYSISGLRDRLTDAVGGWATMTIATSGEMDANSGVHNVAYSGTFSSLFTFTEVLDYPNKVTLAQIDPVKDELIYGIEGSIGTFSAPYATILPIGVTAYYAQQTDMDGTNVLHLTPLNATTEGIPANEGVILVGGADAESKVRMIPATTERVEAISNNAFSNTAAGSVVMQAGDYVLARGDQGIGFYQATGTLKPNNTYLSLGNTSNVSAFRLVFGETTDLNSSVTIVNPDAPIYDLSGRRVMQTVKGGVYIQNGKKFIVK